jgi:flagellar export protein FliJ
MKKYSFRLQKVLDVKETELKKTQRDLVYVENLKIDAKNFLKQCVRNLNHYANEMEHEKSSKVTDMKLKYGHFFDMIEDIESQENKISDLERKAEEIRKRLIGQQKDRKVLTRLHEKFYAEFVREMQKEEQTLLDEMAIIGNQRSVH